MMRIVAGLVVILAALVADVISSLWMVLALFGDSRRGARWWRVAKAKDQVFNAATGGSEDETLSSRAARARDRGERWGCVLCKLLDRIDPRHCDEARGQ